jgi:hypothetical protein
MGDGGSNSTYVQPFQSGNFPGEEKRNVDTFSALSCLSSYPTTFSSSFSPMMFLAGLLGHRAFLLPFWKRIE